MKLKSIIQGGKALLMVVDTSGVILQLDWDSSFYIEGKKQNMQISTDDIICRYFIPYFEYPYDDGFLMIYLSEENFQKSLNALLKKLNMGMCV